MNYKVTVSNYKNDKYYSKVIRAVDEILEKDDIVISTDIFQSIGMLSKENHNKWRIGKVRYLEQVISCNLSKANRILYILGFHAHDMNLVKTIKYVKFKRKLLRFTKNGYKKDEELYARQFSKIGS
jgi:hypothetical protein